MKRLFLYPFFFLVLFPVTTAAQNFRDSVRLAIEDVVGPPGRQAGERTVITVVHAEGNVRFIFLCSAGKEDGLGDDIVDVVYGAINSATGGFSIAIQPIIKSAISRIVVDEGDAYCAAIATKVGATERAENVSDGSIYTNAWRDGELLKAVTDRQACKNIQQIYVCFEVAEAPLTGGKEIDGVSGCFQSRIDGKLFSYSFGRGANISSEVLETFNPGNSVSNIGCVQRGLGEDNF